MSDSPERLLRLPIVIWCGGVCVSVCVCVRAQRRIHIVLSSLSLKLGRNDKKIIVKTLSAFEFSDGVSIFYIQIILNHGISVR